MTNLKIQKSSCLSQTGKLLACEVDAEMNPLYGAAQNVWSAAGSELKDFRENVVLPLQEGSLLISPSYNFKQYTTIAHIVVPSVVDPSHITIEERAKLKNCYDTLFLKARDMEMETLVLPILGQVSNNISSADAVDIAFRAAYEAVESGEMEAVKEILFCTTVKDVYDRAKENDFYKNRKKANNRVKDAHARTCTIGESKNLSTRASKCSGEHVSLLSVIGKWTNCDRMLDLLECSHEADLIMSRIGEFDIDWNSDEAAKFVICKRHLEMFLVDWKNPFWRNFKILDGNPQCSFPEHKGACPGVNRDRSRLVTKSDSLRWMEKRNTILKVGIPLCDEDLAFLRGPDFDPVVSQQDFDMKEAIDGLTDDLDNIPPLPKKIPSTKEPKVKEAVVHLLDTLECKSNVESRKPWDDLSPRQQREKVRLADTALNAVCFVMAGKFQDKLRERVINIGQQSKNNSCDPIKQHLASVAELYERADSKLHRLFILSTVAKVPLPALQEYFIGLSSHLHKKARMLHVKGRIDADRRIRRTRYDEAKLDKLLEFLLSPLVVLNLPFDEKNEKMDDGSTMSMPNLMRLQTIDEIFRMYISFLEEEQISHLALRETTAKYIIKLVAPTRRKNLTCVDEKIADGMQAFDELFKSVDELLKKGFIERDIAAALNKNLQLCKSYLRGDFKAHVKLYSECADHCATFSLSDPKCAKFATDCSTGPHAHVHDSICESELFSNLNDECGIHQDSINEMKRHQVRAALSHKEKTDFIEALSPGECFVTLDWAQKLTPFYAREKQVEYYAKTGISYHIAHAFTVIDGEEAQHSSVHIFEPGEKQDGTAVYLIVKSFLMELKQMGINRCYRNAPLVCSLFNLQEIIGMKIDGLLFSEAQAGKGPCDRDSARIKGKARDHVISTRGKVETKEEFYNDIVSGKLLNGLSVHICTISNVKESASKIQNITSYNSFEFEPAGIRVRRHRSIGEGLLIDSSRLVPCDGRLAIVRSGGHTVESDELFWLTKHSHRSIPSNSATALPSFISSGVFYCPEENCIAEFRSCHQLRQHIFNDKHQFELQRKTIHDYCVEMASLSLGMHAHTSDLGRAVSSSVHSCSTSTLKQGWALREIKKRNKDDQLARDLVRKYFMERRLKGQKANPSDAWEFMRNARGVDGKLLVEARNRLKMTQIKSLINGLLKNEDPASSTKKGVKPTPVAPVDSSDESNEDDVEESDDEQALRKLVLRHKDKLFTKKKDGQNESESSSESDEDSEEDEPRRKRGRGN